MRPIDADTLIAYLNDWMKKLHAGVYHNDAIIMDVLMSVYEHIGDVPTFEVVPRDEYEMLLKRFRHLLKSDFIRSFDEHDLKTHTYKRDISVADEIANERQGEWIINNVVIDNNGRTMPDWPECSECRKKSDLEYNYCPNCGAKMDLEG